MAKVVLSDIALKDIDNILASVYDFTSFITTPQKLLIEFNKPWI